jgi:hypothetical protein
MFNSVGSFERVLICTHHKQQDWHVLLGWRLGKIRHNPPSTPISSLGRTWVRSCACNKHANEDLSRECCTRGRHFIFSLCSIHISFVGSKRCTCKRPSVHSVLLNMRSSEMNDYANTISENSSGHQPRNGHFTQLASLGRYLRTCPFGNCLHGRTVEAFTVKVQLFS